MRLKYLKKFRLVFSILYFLFLIVLFVDFTHNIPKQFYNIPLFLQFTPSFLTFKNSVYIAGLGFIFILILTLLFGRVYCSFICPLGILKDLISYFAKKAQKLKRYKYKYQKPFTILRYSFLSLFLIGLLFGFSIFVSLLDPYSVFGRISSELFRLVVVGINNAVDSVFQRFDLYVLFHVDLTLSHWLILLITVLYLSLIIYMAVTKGRIYCNTICPVGTVLGLVSSLSIFKIKIDKSTCTSCHLCENVCKAGCIDIPNQEIDFNRCVSCYNCLTVCPVNSVLYTNKTISVPKENEIKSPNNRRYFLAVLALLFTVKKTKAQDLVSNNATFPAKRKTAVSPPGSISLSHFNDSCTACHLCISACPTQVLQPSYVDYGLVGFMQPVMDNHAGFCNYDCIKCAEACPTDAIKLLELENKRLAQIGIAHFVKQNCIVETEGTDCGACAEHCPTKAVHMVPYKNNLVIPEVSEDICIGCGACEFACPTTPFKAIYVEGNLIHMTANKPKDAEQEVQIMDDFPF